MSGKDRVWMQEQCFIERSRQTQKGKSKSIDKQSIRRSADRFKSAGLNSINKTDIVNPRKACTKDKKKTYDRSKTFQRFNGLFMRRVLIKVM